MFLYRDIEKSFIYEVVRNKENNSIVLFGPLDNNTIKIAFPLSSNGFVQVINHKPVAFFEQKDLLFMNKAI